MMSYQDEKRRLSAPGHEYIRNVMMQKPWLLYGTTATIDLLVIVNHFIGWD